MNAGIQRFFASLGSDGCFAICIAEGGKPGRPARDMVELAIQGQQFRYLRSDMLVLKQAAFMGLCAGGQWTHTVELASYQPNIDEICIEKWAYTDADGDKHEHFALRLDDGTLWDPLGNSETLKQGRCIEKRIFRRL